MEEIHIRVGIVGAGGNTRARHIPGLQALDGVEIGSVCNRTRASSEQVAQAFGIPKVYENWMELVADPDINAIVIGTWPYMHAPVMLAALAADKHVLCEARMAMNAKEAHTIYETARLSPHLVAQIVPSPFTLQVDRTIQRLIREGYLGNILVIEVRDYGEFLDVASPLQWRQDMDLSGYNVMTLGIWYEALMRWVGEAQQVVAMGKTFVTMRRDERDIMRAVRIPEHLDVIANMACGAQLHMQLSRAAGLAGPTEVYLFGSQGTLRFADNRLYGGRRGAAQLEEIAIPPEEEGHWRVEEEFVNAIRGKERVTLTTLEDGIKYMEFTEAVARSAATGIAVTLPL